MTHSGALLVWILLMFPAQWLLVTLRVPEPLALLLFVAFVFVSQLWLLARVRCRHCGERLQPHGSVFERISFWQRYLFFGGACPHCGRRRSASRSLR